MLNQSFHFGGNLSRRDSTTLPSVWGARFVHPHCPLLSATSCLSAPFFPPAPLFTSVWRARFVHPHCPTLCDFLPVCSLLPSCSAFFPHPASVHPHCPTLCD